jgi:hypothetical protein
MESRREWRDETTEGKKGNPIKQGGREKRGDGKEKGNRETEGRSGEEPIDKGKKGRGETNHYQLTTQY